MAAYFVGAIVLAQPAVSAAQFADEAPTDDGTPSLNALLDGHSLNDVWLHINARDWADLHATYREGTYYPADFEWNGVRVRNAGVRVRGRFTRNDRKPSLRLDFNRYVTGQQFLGVKALVLNSLWMDPSMLRDRLSMSLFRRMGIPAPREAHVRLFVGANREFAGVYAVVEEVNPAFLDANFGESNGYLYEYRIQDDPYGFEYPGTDLEWYRTRFTAQTHENASLAELYTPVRALVEAVNAATPATLEGDLADYLNIETFITEIAVQNFAAQNDGLLGQFGMNNFYLYRFEGRSLAQIVPWDQDGSFRSLDMPPWQNVDTNVLATKIWGDARYRELYLRKLLEVADVVDPAVSSGASSYCQPAHQSTCGWLQQEVRRQYTQIREAVYQDPLAPYPLEEFEADVAFLDQFARDRAAIVRRYIAQVAPWLLTDSPGSSGNVP